MDAPDIATFRYRSRIASPHQDDAGDWSDWSDPIGTNTWELSNGNTYTLSILPDGSFKAANHRGSWPVDTRVIQLFLPDAMYEFEFEPYHVAARYAVAASEATETVAPPTTKDVFDAGYELGWKQCQEKLLALLAVKGS